MAEHDDRHSESFQIKFPNVFTHYPLGAVRVEDQRFKGLGSVQIHSMAIAIEFHGLLCIQCLRCIC